MTDNKTGNQDIEPPKYVDSFIVPNSEGNRNSSSYDFKIINLKQIQKYDQMNKVVSYEDMTDDLGNTMFVKLEHTFGNDYSTIKMLGEKPIILDHTEAYIEPEKTNHNDFIFMILLPFACLMILLNRRRKRKIK